MSSARRTRLERLEARHPAPAAAPEVEDQVPIDELRRRFDAWLSSPESLAELAALRALPQDELLRRWEEMPRYRGGRGGGR